MSTLHPVKRAYEPGYPAVLRESELELMLRPGLMRQFSRRTLFLGGLLASTAFAAAPGEAPRLPMAGHSTRNDDDLRARVDAIIENALAKYEQRFWYEHSSVGLSATIAANPPLKTPRVAISFGNSFMGIFDAERAKAVTHELFKAYGIELTPDVPLKTEDCVFSADGYNQDLTVGFELRVPERQKNLNNTYYGKNEKPAARLDDDELKTLEAEIAAGAKRMFVANAASYALYDGDYYTPMRYYLASVVDYLNWIHGDRDYDLNTVLGETPPGLESRAWHNARPALPGCDFEAEADLERWTVQGGTFERTARWSTHGKHALKLTLEPGGEAVYTPPKDVDVTFGVAGSFSMKALIAQPEDAPAVYVPVGFTVQVEGDRVWSAEKVLRPGSGRFVETPMEWDYAEDESPGRVRHVRIRTDSPGTITLFIDDMGVMIGQLEAKSPGG